MKNYIKLFYSGALVCFASTVFADNASTNPVSEMMKQTTEMMEQGNKAMQEAAEKAAQDAKAAVAKLPSFSINSMNDDDKDEEASDDFQWTMENIKLADQGDAKRGEELAKKAKCSKCHGDTGVSEEDDTPSIAGQVTAYSFKQLHDYKVGLRDSKSMRKQVKNMTPKDMADVSAFYATQTPEKKLGSATPPVLAIKGDAERYMLACDSCHNDDSAKRGYQTPIIDGQKIEYFIETMIAFKEEDRVNDHYSLMRAIAAKLSEEEIEELAAYYSAKPLEED